MPVKVFFCYAHEDEQLLNKLKMHLRSLQREGLIDIWHDQDISAGAEWAQEISNHLNDAQIILLLISPDFMNSEYCYSIEMKRALERHEQKEAYVIPVILRPVRWQIAPLRKLQALPKDAQAVTSPFWQNLDEALYSVAEGIRKIVEDMNVHTLVDSIEQSDAEDFLEPPILSAPLSPYHDSASLEKLQIQMVASDSSPHTTLLEEKQDLIDFRKPILIIACATLVMLFISIFLSPLQ